jgi:hypothetical protein
LIPQNRIPKNQMIKTQDCRIKIDVQIKGAQRRAGPGSWADGWVPPRRPFPSGELVSS